MFLKSKCKWDGGQNRWVYVFDDQPDGARPITQTTLDELVTTIKWDAEENGFAPNGPTPRPTAAPTVESTPRTPKEIRAARNQASLLEAIQELRQAAGYARQQPSSDALVGKMWRAQRKVTELEQGHEDGESRVDRAARAPDYAPPSASETTGSSGSDAGNAAAWRMIREGRQGKRS
jgi:hypothetical protein